MKKTNKILAAGITALSILGFAAVVNAVDGEGLGMRGFGHALKRGGNIGGLDKTTLLEDLGLPEDATREQIMEARWQKRLTQLGVSEDSTVRDFHAAMKAHQTAQFEEHLAKLKEDLGLPADATQEAVQSALEEKRGKGEGKGFGPRRGGHGDIWRGCRLTAG